MPAAAPASGEPAHPVRGNWVRRSDRLGRIAASGVAVPWPVGPLLEPGAATVTGELIRGRPVTLGPEWRPRSAGQWPAGFQQGLQIAEYPVPAAARHADSASDQFGRHGRLVELVGER